MIRKIITFLMGLLILGATFASVFFAVLTYRANDQIAIKSYLFQINDAAGLRVGALQDINDISAIDLRNKLITKYVSEYFKVIPSDKNVVNRPILRKLSTQTAFNQWLNSEAKTISKMSDKNMFRMVRVIDNGIVSVDKPADYDYYNSDIIKPIFYEVHYITETWSDSNIMGIEPIVEQGILYLQAQFKPGIFENIDIKKHLENGGNPVELFIFRVTRIGNENN